MSSIIDSKLSIAEITSQLNTLAPKLPSIPKPVRPANWGHEWVHLSDLPKEFSQGIVATTTSSYLAANHNDPIAQLIVILDQSVYQALIDQAYSSSSSDTTGYLGGSWTPIQLPPMRGFSEGSWKLVCHVTHFFAGKRNLEDLLSGNVVEDDQSIESAVARFKELDVECIGWYRTSDPLNPLQPTRADASKQALLQSIIPDGVGVLVSVGSSNNPNRFFPNIPLVSPAEPLQAPSHSLMAFRSFITKPDNVIQIEKAYAPLPSGDPRPYIKDLVYNKDLRAFTVPMGVRTEKYCNPIVLDETFRSIELGLEEARQIFLLQSINKGKAEKYFLNCDFDQYLTSFWKRSIGGAQTSLSQELRKLEAQKRWVMKDIQKLTRDLKDVWDSVIAETPEAGKVADFEDVVQDLMEKKAHELGLDDIKTDDAKPIDDEVYLLKGLTRVAMELESNPGHNFVVPKIQPDIAYIQESVLYEDNLYDISVGRLKKNRRSTTHRKRKVNDSSEFGIKDDDRKKGRNKAKATLVAEQELRKRLQQESSIESLISAANSSANTSSVGSPIVSPKKLEENEANDKETASLHHQFPSYEEESPYARMGYHPQGYPPKGQYHYGYMPHRSQAPYPPSQYYYSQPGPVGYGAPRSPSKERDDDKNRVKSEFDKEGSTSTAHHPQAPHGYPYYQMPPSSGSMRNYDSIPPEYRHHGPPPNSTYYYRGYHRDASPEGSNAGHHDGGSDDGSNSGRHRTPGTTRTRSVSPYVQQGTHPSEPGDYMYPPPRHSRPYGGPTSRHYNQPPYDYGSHH